MKADKSIYFTGIGGAGMSALAELLRQWGYKVSGSDRQESPVTERLRAQGITVHIGHDAAHVQQARLLVYSAAVAPDNPELRAAREMGIPAVKRAALLGQLMTGKKGIAVAGTHGKTTTTSMISHLFRECGLRPTAVLGGTLSDSGRGAMAGDGNWFITEADEYDRSFLTLYPLISIVNNLEADHLEIYGDVRHLTRAFGEFISHTPLTGQVIYNGEDPLVHEAVRGAYGDTLSFGLTPEMDVYATDIRVTENGTRCTVVHDGKEQGTLEIKLPGRHNVRNALAALAAGSCAGLKFEEMARALAGFGGVDRRFQFKGEAGGALFYDDYAHHPTEVRAALEAARSGWQRRIVAVFQPHLFSRTRDFAGDFAAALDLADTVILAPIYPAREEPLPGVTSERIAREMQRKALLAGSREETIALIQSVCAPNDLVLVMGAGNIWSFAAEAMNRLKQRETGETS